MRKENLENIRPADDYAEQRLKMVAEQIERRGVRDERVLAAMRTVPRHRFVPPEEIRSAYDDTPLPIGYSQTISQPYIVAYMTEIIELDGSERVLEIGTGSGYQAAILAELAKEVYTIEIVEALCLNARELLAAMGYENVTVKCGDGYEGWAEYAPFDVIILTAAARNIPRPLIQQLNIGGKLLLPLGRLYQELVLLVKNQDGSLERKKLIPVRFVPMTGEAEKK